MTTAAEAWRMYERMKESGEPIAVTADQMPDLVRMGIKVEQLAELGILVVDGDDGPDETDVIVCASGANYYYSDNVFTACAECGGCIQHRPNVPEKPKKICFGCATKRAEDYKREHEDQSAADAG